MKPKVIAFYLPQFHRIPENDEWWGEGFTDWESARKAKPLFSGHNQPRIPADGNYYNLLDKRTMEWQAKLARKAGVYGFCIYHYWFGEKQLLEKPAENLLKWKDIDIHYCFSWANESWIRSWSKFTGNAWTDSPAAAKQNSTGMLAEQTYGAEEEWKRHFLYLLPFFKDERYIKKDGKPVFVIYLPSAVKCLRKMARYWNRLAMANGLPGIYFIGTNCKDWRSRGLDAELWYEPNRTRFYEENFYSVVDLWVQKWRKSCMEKGLFFPEILNYRKTWKAIINRKFTPNAFPGGFVDFDASPRKEKRATIFLGASPGRFRRYFQKLYRRCREEGVEFIFLTAWNEWGEGAYLEPDEKYGKGYLNAVRKTIKENISYYSNI